MGEVVLVTLNSKSVLSTIRVISTLSNFSLDGVDCVIFNSSSDSDLDLVRYLTNLSGKVNKVIYINKSINPLHYCIFTGLNADIYDSEDYLADEDILNFLVSNYKSTGLTMRQSSNDLDTLAKSIAAISSSSVDAIQKLVSNDFWTRTLTTAVTNVKRDVALSNQVNIDVVDMLTECSKLINELEEGQDRSSNELEKLHKLILDMEKKQRPNTPFYFSTYTVPVNVQKVLYIKVYSDCRYLKSMIGAYHHYLKMSKQVSSKVLFIMPKLKLYIQKYKEVATRLDQDSVEVVNYQSPFFITFEPKKIVMDAFFNQQNIGLFIVVDFMFGEILVDGHMVTRLNAIGGLSDLETFNLSVESTLTSLTGRSGNLIIPHINSYQSSNDSTRRSFYFDKCSDLFSRIDKIVNLGGR